MSILQLAGYASIIFFVIVVAAKLIKIARMPIHIRWDLYPIPHEKGKGDYGGSYFEEVNWWTKPTNFSLFSELKEMAREIIFIQSVFRHNKPLWVFSFPFHLGLYCLCGFLAMLVLGAILGAAGVAITAAGGLGQVVHYLTVSLGTVGFFLAGLGAIGLFFSRLGGEIGRASVLSDYVNLLMLLAVCVSGLVTWFTVDPNYALVRSFVQSLLTFQPVAALPAAVTTLLSIWVVLMCYFPFTHMTHMFGKYFTYHKIRWEDHPNIRGGKIEKQVQEALGYNITWAAPHIKSGGSWADAATAPEEDGSHE